ncbi:aminopeptidase N [Auraticoccus monumenti]|uniref:Aminopeptidase N n=1 Tax=Auraticoccus monumenti TaxID=675864 RepID=A0A1G6V6S7_9ACTN|nr:aminopeptidase N [Auraticoccus monumenti]SDD49380.1 Membrane alanyl aminopeptidase Metallo peptidase. MEROPS family M01 [Auraticoccus monumenti]
MPLSLPEARDRAALIEDVSYEITLDLTDRAAFRSTTTVRFGCHEPGASTFLELADALDVTVSGSTRPTVWADGRIALTDLQATNEVTVDARLPYVTDGAGMHTFTDPADDHTYVSAYTGMDLSQRVFACFDQNDLKAPVSLTVLAPEGWTVLANGRLAAQQDGRWEFAPTPPIPIPMFVVCAGPWHSRTWDFHGLPFGWHARASLAEVLDRELPELQRVTEACFEHYGRTFTEPFAFDSYDQVFAPGQNWGALESPGCVTYRDELLPPAPTETERRTRAMVIAHEMAHMWFGNLVTMRWWEDTWLQESFADYMGYQVAEAAAGVADARADFTIRAKRNALLADERRSTHPVAALSEEVPDVDTALGNFDAISYAKGNACLQQLVTWLGEDTFLAGTDAYLSRHAFANTELTDFVDALDAVTDRDVRGWVESWLRTTGFDTIRVRRGPDGPELVREGTRRHRLAVTAYDQDLTPLRTEVVDLGDDPVPVPDGAAVVPDSGSHTFARLRMDARSWEVLTRGLSALPEPAARAVVWNTAFDLVRCGEARGEDYLDLLAAHLPAEPRATFVEAIVQTALDVVVPSHLPAGAATPALARVADACARGLAAGPSAEVAAYLLRGLARSTDDAALLHGWLDDGRTSTGVPLDPTLRWLATTRLAQLGALDTDGVAAQQRLDPSMTGTLGAARARAAIPTAAAKEAAWRSLTTDPDVSNRVFEATAAGFWDPEHLDLVLPYVGRYVEVVPTLAGARGATFGRTVAAAFPSVPLTDEHLAAFDRALAGDLPTVVRRTWQDRLDDLPRRPTAA